MKLIALLALLFSCAHQGKGPTGTDKIVVYPSFPRLLLSNELLDHSINKMELARKSENKTKKSKHLAGFASKYKQFEEISRTHTIYYNGDKDGYVKCDGERSCSLYHFTLGKVCYEGDAYKAVKTLKTNFDKVGEEYGLENFYVKKKRIYYTLLDKANGTSTEDYFVRCD